MARVFRSVTKRIFIVANIIVVAVFLLACMNAFLPPAKYWYIAMLGLGFPFLLLAVIGFLILWMLFRSKWAFLPLVALILGYSNIRALIGFNILSPSFSKVKAEGSLRIMTWNVTWFDEQTRAGRKSGSYRDEMIQYIREQNADVLCFQEYLEPNKNRKYNNMKDFMAMGYNYHVKAIDYFGGSSSLEVGVIIFSRYPIVDSFHVKYEGPKASRAAESLIAADIDKNGQRIRIFNTHLQSILLKKDDYRYVKMIRTADDSIMEASKSIMKKLKQGYTYRGDQVDIVRKNLDESPYPEVICGDFNDVPNSYTYFQVKGNRKDAFVRKGRGLGRSFYALSPTLRIDFIITNPQFEILQYKKDELPYSDHYPLVSDIRLIPQDE